MILCRVCLLGINCRYNGKNAKNGRVITESDPSCGMKRIPDCKGKRIPGMGVTAKLLMENRIKVISEEEV